MVVLCRTSPEDEENRHDGMSQLIVDLHVNGVTIRPITFLTGEHHFNEVFLKTFSFQMNKWSVKSGMVGNKEWQNLLMKEADQRESSVHTHYFQA